jgi:hypothetical protein
VRIEQRDGTLVEEFGDAIGITTNNVVEYRGLIAALEWAVAQGRQSGQRRYGWSADLITPTRRPAASPSPR